MSDYTHVIITGDLNTCMMKNNYRAQKLGSIFQSLNLNILPLQPTHHTNTADTLLDLIIVSQVHLIAGYRQYLAPAFSLHDFIFISYAIKVPKAKPKTLNLRNYSGIDLDKLCCDASIIDWTDLLDMETVDEKVEYLRKCILDLFDRHAPLRQIKMKHNRCPWFNDDYRKARASRDRAFRRYKNDRTDVNWTIYKSSLSMQ